MEKLQNLNLEQIIILTFPIWLLGIILIRAIIKQILGRKYTEPVEAWFSHPRVKPQGFSTNLERNNKRNRVISFKYKGRFYNITKHIPEGETRLNKKFIIYINPNDPESGFKIPIKERLKYFKTLAKPEELYSTIIVISLLIILAWAFAVYMSIFFDISGA